MAQVTTFPFKRPPAECVDCGPWQIPGLESPPNEIPYLSRWDCNSSIKVERELGLNVDQILAAAELAQDSKLRLTVSTYSSGTHLRRPLFSLELARGNHQRIEITATVDGRELSGDLVLITRLVLASPGTSSSPLAAHTAGSLLWQDRQKILLEGKASRFPIEVLDFKDLSWADNSAGWYLDWNEDGLDQPMLGAIRLFINRNHAAVLKAVTAQAPDKEDQLILSAIFHDVGRSLLVGALNNEDFVNDPGAYAAGSLGGSIRAMLNAIFPGETLLSLRQLQQQKQSNFECLVQGRLNLFKLGK